MQSEPPGPTSSDPTQEGKPQRLPDPGTPRRARIASIVALVLIGVVALLQQLAASPGTRAAGQPPLAADIGPAPAQLTMFAKTGVKWFYVTVSPAMPEEERAALAEKVIDTLESSAATPEDDLRVAMVIADLIGPEAARDELDDVRAGVAENSPLLADIATLEQIYARGPGSIDAQTAAAFTERHGWFGRLALAHGLPDEDPARDAVVGGGVRLVAALLGFGLLVFCAVAAGLTLFIVAIVKASAGTLRPRFIPPLPGGSVAIETVAVFAAGFIGLKVATGVVAWLAGEGVALWFALIAQWVLALLIFWPIFRGVPREQWLYLVGLYRGRGILREVGAGIVGYLAVLPLLLGGIMLSVGLVMLAELVARMRGKPPPSAPENQIIELIGGNHGPALIVLFFFLASLWAPLVEEAIFRGCLYRHLRARWHWLPAGIVTALGFGLMHAYPLILLGPVIALGLGFAMIREWRSSLIASMTAHCLHNATVLTFLLTILSLIGD